MIKATITINQNQLQRTLDDFVVQLADDTFKSLKANTPIKTGNARRGWTKKVNGSSAVIENKVPYIGRLEAGASRQAPKGIIGPTLTEIKGKYK